MEQRALLSHASGTISSLGPNTSVIFLFILSHTILYSDVESNCCACESACLSRCCAKRRIKWHYPRCHVPTCAFFIRVVNWHCHEMLYHLSNGANGESTVIYFFHTKQHTHTPSVHSRRVSPYARAHKCWAARHVLNQPPHSHITSQLVMSFMVSLYFDSLIIVTVPQGAQGHIWYVHERQCWAARDEARIEADTTQPHHFATNYVFYGITLLR